MISEFSYRCGEKTRVRCPLHMSVRYLFVAKNMTPSGPVELKCRLCGALFSLEGYDVPGGSFRFLSMMWVKNTNEFPCFYHPEKGLLWLKAWHNGAPSLPCGSLSEDYMIVNDAKGLPIGVEYQTQFEPCDVITLQYFIPLEKKGGRP